MPLRKANQAQFVFICGDLDETIFAVSSFTGEESISSPYSFSIYLRSADADVLSADVINKQATLFILRNGEYVPYSGIVTGFRYIGTNTDNSEYHIQLVPRIWLLNYYTQTRVFQKMTFPEIIEKVFEESELSDYYTMDVQGTYPQREYIVQYQESDMNFISRLMEEVGIWYFFKELPILQEEIDGVNREELIMTDKVASFQHISGEAALLYRSDGGVHDHSDGVKAESVSEISYEEQIVPLNITMKNYNYRTPEVRITAQKKIVDGIVGKVYKYGEEFLNSDGAQNAAAIEADRHTTERIKVRGVSDCSGFKAGFRFELSEHKREECNDNYLLKSVSHTGSHESGLGGSGAPSYNNAFLAIPSAVVKHYRPAIIANIPKINGIITATIEASGSDYASIDDMARYKVRMPFDLSDSENYDASKYVRLAQPYSGSNYGIHFPSHEGAEMIMACIDGNPNRPVGIGTVPNTNTLSPVVSNNKAQGIIRTAGGNELIMDDIEDKQKVTLNSNAKNTILLDDENDKIQINTTGDDDGNNTVLMDDANKKIEIKAMNHLIKMSYGDEGKEITIQTENESFIKIDDENEMITIQTTGGNSIQMDDGGKSIVVTDGAGKNTVTLDGDGNGLSLESDGEIKIAAKGDIVMEAANITMTAQQKIEATANMDIALKGMNIEAKADMNMTVEGGMNTEVTGMMLKAEGKTMADFKGGAKTTLTGGIVMIN